MSCLDERMLSSYLDGGSSGSERREIEEHVSGCERCLGLLAVAYEAQDASCRCPAALKSKIKNRLGLKKRKARPELKWLFGALVLFLASFIFKEYFLQFLAAALVLGFKWAMTGEGAKQAVMIFRAIKPGEKKFERKAPPDVSDVIGGDEHGEAR